MIRRFVSANAVNSHESDKRIDAAHKQGYRASIMWSILFHGIIFTALIVSGLWFNAKEYQAPSQAVQATLVSTAAVAAMEKAAQAKPSPPKPVPPQPKPEPPKPTPPKPTPPVPPVKEATPKPTPEPKPLDKTPIAKDAAIVKPQPQKTSPPKAVKQKVLDQSMLQDEIKQQVKQNQAAKKQQQQQELLQQLAAEESSDAKSDQLSEQKSAMSAKTQGEVDKYKGLILQKIQQNWIMPQNVKDLQCLLQVQVAPGGMVLNVKLLKSSGNDALDRSAIAAVNKSSPLPVPKDTAAFAEFRAFTITVKPNGDSNIN